MMTACASLHQLQRLFLVMMLATISAEGSPFLVILPESGVTSDSYDWLASQVASSFVGGESLRVVVAIDLEQECALCIDRTTPSGCEAAQSGLRSLWGNSSSEEVVLGGHGSGASCASALASSFPEEYTALVALAPPTLLRDDYYQRPFVPELLLGAELDGGPARPSALSVALSLSDAAASEQDDSDWQLRAAPVAVLRGVNHAFATPGVRFKGDVEPDENAPANALPELIAAFLNIHLGLEETHPEALVRIGEAISWTRSLVGPFYRARMFEASADGQSPLCEDLQRALAGLDPEDTGRQLATSSIVALEISDFEKSRASYDLEVDDEGGRRLTANVSCFREYHDPSDKLGCSVAPAQVDCKLLSPERIAEQLELGVDDYTPWSTCGVGNMHAVALAMELLNSTAAGQTALERYERYGREICFADDRRVYIGNVGYLDGSVTVSENATCRSYGALRLGPNSLEQQYFAGVQYCKTLSPAAVIEWVWTDSLLSDEESGCSIGIAEESASS